MRRRQLLLAGASLLAASAHARISQIGGLIPPQNSEPVTPDFQISFGQSWRSNEFPSFGTFDLNPQPQTLLTGRVFTFNGTSFVDAPVFAGSGIALQTLDGITGYGPPYAVPTASNITIGRCSVLAQQLLRIRDSQIPLTPIIEMCWAFPGATWTQGGGGGLSPGSNFVASVTNDLMTVTALNSGTIAVNQILPDTAGLSTLTAITELGTGTGGVGTYKIGKGQIFLAQTLTTSGGASFFGNISNASAEAGNILNVGTLYGGAIAAGDTVLPVTPVLSGTTIDAQIDGTTGGVGNYRVVVGAKQSVGSETMNGRGISWRNQGINIGQIATILPFGGLLSPTYSSVGYTQGDASDGTTLSKIADLTDMLTKYDALNLPGAGTTGMRYYFELPSAVTQATTFPVSSWGTYSFCRANAPEQGGPWSGRCFATSPSYAWPFNGIDNIHTGAYGTVRWGEWEGYVKHLTQDLGIAWTPLWRPLTGGAITRSGQVLTVPMARPSGPDFAASPMVWQSEPNDGIMVWPQYGWNVKRSGVFLTVSPAISGMNVLLTVTETIHSGDTIEVSYAFYGPGGTPITDNRSGVGGNLCMNGPPSVLVPGNTIDAWAWPFYESVTV